LRTELPAISKPQWIPIAQPKATENQNARDHRIERKKQTAQQVNENSTQNLNEKIIEQLRLNLVLLEDYATKHEIPKNVPIPPNVALSLSNRSIQSVPYRNYLIRKHIDSAQDFLMEIGELPQETLHPFHRKKIMDQTKAIRRLLSLLKSFH
jgi:hypothetical protein